MARPRNDPDREETPLRLLKAAEAAFGDHGFARARLADVAARAGVSRPSLLHHFGTKVALYEAVVARAFADLRAELDAVVLQAGEGFGEVLDAVTRRLLDFAEARPAVASLVLRELIERGGEHRTDLLERELVPLVDRLEALVRERGGALVAPDYPVRDAILAVFVAHLVGAAAAPDAPRLWPSKQATPVLVRALLLAGARPPAAPSPAQSSLSDLSDARSEPCGGTDS